MLYRMLVIPAAFLLLSCSPTYHTSESEVPCKVLVESISEQYEGYCKDDLAHGEGIARGEETYIGEFRNGYPHGEGTYITYVGKKELRYEGEWVEGKSTGFGKVYYTLGDEEKTKSGFWQDGVLQVPADRNKSYLIKSQRGSVKVSARKKDITGNKVKLYIQRDGQNAQHLLENLAINHTSGTRRGELPLHFFEGYLIENINYPFTLIVSYQIPNKMGGTLIDTYVELEMVEPGNWLVELNNN